MLQHYSIRKKLNFIFISFTAVAVVITTIAIGALAIVSSVRAFVTGESLWSKGLNQSFYHLSRFATTQNSREYDDFLTSMTTPVAANNALIELEKPSPDIDKAYGYFMDVLKNPNEPVHTMVQLFLVTHNLPHVSEAVRIWHIGDDYCHRLQELGQRYQEKMRNNSYLAADQANFISELDKLNESANTLEAQFSAAFAEAAQWVLSLLYFLIPLSAALVTFAGIILSRSISNSVSSGIEVLQAATKRMAEGDLEYKIEIKSQDELGRLAQSFNDMSAALVESQQKLFQSQKMAALGIMAEEVGEEIENPLALIKLNLHLIKDILSQQPTDAAKIKEKVGIITDTVNNISKTVFQLATLSREK